jgi:predicted acetyltransferase
MKLIKPSIEYKKEYINFVKQIRRNNEIESSYTFKLSFLKFNFQKFLDYLDYISDYPKGEIIIPMTNFWAVVDGKIVGRITLRKDSREDLFYYIGNVGYITAPEERGKGYATEMLRLLKPIAKESGHRKLLITCNKNNLNSKKVIEKNGGIFLDEIKWEERNIKNLRYEILL